jgi:hypothetical protein
MRRLLSHGCSHVSLRERIPTCSLRSIHESSNNAFAKSTADGIVRNQLLQFSYLDLQQYSTMYQPFKLLLYFLW